MRAVLVLLAAAAGFGVFLHATHDRAARLLANEAAALERIRGGEGETEGYRIVRVRAEGLPDLRVARPVRPGRDGVRWFATVEGEAVYEFDTVTYAVPDDAPDTGALHRYLATAADRRPPDPPFGWRRVE